MLHYTVIFMKPEFMRKQMVETILVHATGHNVKEAIATAREDTAVDLMLGDPEQLILLIVLNGWAHAYNCTCHLCTEHGFPAAQMMAAPSPANDAKTLPQDPA